VFRKQKKVEFHQSFLKSLAGLHEFSWHFVPTNQTIGGIVVGVKSDVLMLVNSECKDFSISCMVQDKKTCFSWKLVMIYGSPYEC
jgi:hypothetical protein